MVTQKSVNMEYMLLPKRQGNSKKIINYMKYMHASSVLAVPHMVESRKRRRRENLERKWIFHINASRLNKQMSIPLWYKESNKTQAYPAFWEEFKLKDPRPSAMMLSKRDNSCLEAGDDSWTGECCCILTDHSTTASLNVISIRGKIHHQNINMKWLSFN